MAYAYWLIAGSLACVYCLILLSHAGLTSGGHSWYDTIAIILKVIFAIDMFVNCYVAYWDGSRGKWITDQKKIVLNYLCFWFWIDFIAVFPFEMVLQPSVDTNTRIVRSLTLFRLARLVRAFQGSLPHQ